jgi:integrase
MKRMPRSSRGMMSGCAGMTGLEVVYPCGLSLGRCPISPPALRLMPLPPRRPGFTASRPSGAWRRRRWRPMRGTSGSSRSSWANIWAGRPGTARWRNLRSRISAPSWPDAGKQGAESRTLARQLSSLRSFYRFAEKKGLFRNPALAAIRSPKLPHAVPKPLAPEKAMRLVKADVLATEDTPRWVLARDAAVLTLLYACGLRISEALALTRGQTDQTVLTVTGKGNKTRIVPLLPVARAAVALYLDLCPFALPPNEPMFRGVKGGPLNARNIQLLIARLRGRAGASRNGNAACAAPLLRNPSPQPWGGPSRDPGTAGPCQPFDHAGLYGSEPGTSARTVSQGSSARVRVEDGVRAG